MELFACLLSSESWSESFCFKIFNYVESFARLILAMWNVGGVPVVPRNYGLIFSSFFFTTLAFVVVCMRTYTRAALVKNLGADDVLMVVALVRIPYFNLSIVKLMLTISSSWAR